MKIRKDVINFGDTKINLKADDYTVHEVIMTIGFLLCTALEHMNTDAFRGDDARYIVGDIELEDGHAAQFDVVNLDGDQVQVLLDGYVMEEANVIDLANEFVLDISGYLDELLGTFPKDLRDEIRDDIEACIKEVMRQLPPVPMS